MPNRTTEAIYVHTDPDGDQLEVTFNMSFGPTIVFHGFDGIDHETTAVRMNPEQFRQMVTAVESKLSK
jgi:hypothetical protein